MFSFPVLIIHLNSYYDRPQQMKEYRFFYYIIWAIRMFEGQSVDLGGKSTWFHNRNQWCFYKLLKTAKEMGSVFSLFILYRVYCGQYTRMFYTLHSLPVFAWMCCLEHCCLTITFLKVCVWVCYCFTQIGQTPRKRPLIMTLNKNKNATLLFMFPFFMNWTKHLTFSMYTEVLFLSNTVHKSV